MAVVGKIPSKGRTTVPWRIREALGVGAGDFLAWEMSGDGVARVRGVKPWTSGTCVRWRKPWPNGAVRRTRKRTVIFEPAGSDAGAAGRG